ncbi:MAG: TonB-dependent receptor [Bacteroidetes bacterium]|jgi:outer membrane receptor for ferrienterochelin and colicins|nr:TonB-dependent receptor [Bacteroidota bacterium]
MMAISLLAALGVCAQSSIQVHNTDRVPLPGAVCEVRTLDGQIIAQGIADGRGRFVLANPSPVGVQIVVRHLGYADYMDTIQIQGLIQVVMEESVIGLDELVITAQYSPGSDRNSVYQVRVTDGRTLDNMAAVNLTNALSTMVNIRVSQDNILGGGLSMQGLSGQNVKILIDGVPVIGRMDGQIDLNQLNMNDVERIEIIEGPLSALYGSNALAGTINIITKKGVSGKPRAQGSLYFENNGTHNLGLSGSGKVAKAAIRVSAGRNWFDGWSPGDAFWPSYRPQLADARRHKSWKPKLQQFGRIGVQATIMGWRSDLRFEAFAENILNRGLPRLPYGETAFDDTYQTRRQDLAWILQRQWKDYRIESTLSANHFGRVKTTYLTDLTTLDRQPSINASDHDATEFTQWLARGTVSSVKVSSKWNWQVGYDLVRETALGQRIEKGSAAMGDYSLFASAEWRKPGGLVVKPAIRATYNTVYQAPITPTFHVLYKFGRYSMRAAYARGFRAPALKELYFFFFDINHNITGNSKLKAERSHNLSAQLENRQTLGKGNLLLGVSAYHNAITNLITLAQVEGPLYSYINIGRYATQGIKAEAKLLGKKTTAQLMANRLGVWSEVQGPKHTKYNYANELAFNIQQDFPNIGLSLALFAKYQGKTQSFFIDNQGNTTTQRINPYWLADCTLGKQFGHKMLTLHTGCKNLFDVRNVSALLQGGTHSNTVNSIAVGMGRTWFVKLTIAI